MQSVDFSSAAYLANPYPALDALAAEKRVYWHAKFETWLVADHDTARHVLSDASRFSSYPPKGTPFGSDVESLQTIDGDRHRRTRALLRDLLNSWAPSRGQLRSFVEDVILAVGQEGEVFCAARDVAEPIAIAAVSSLAPLSEVEIRQVRDDAPPILTHMAGRPDAAAAADEARRDISRLLEGFLARVSVDLDQDLPLASSLRVAVLAGLNSLSRAIGLIMLGLAADNLSAPLETAAQLARRYLRNDPPVQAIRRYTVGSQTLLGTEVAPGEAVTVLVGAANRQHSAGTVRGNQADEELTWGIGPHRCMGRATATAVLEELVRAAIARGGPLLVGQVVYGQNPALRGVLSANMKWPS